jgi:hypothetical protein
MALKRKATEAATAAAQKKSRIGMQPTDDVVPIANNAQQLVPKKTLNWAGSRMILATTRSTTPTMALREQTARPVASGTTSVPSKAATSASTGHAASRPICEAITRNDRLLAQSPAATRRSPAKTIFNDTSRTPIATRPPSEPLYATGRAVGRASRPTAGCSDTRMSTSPSSTAPTSLRVTRHLGRRRLWPHTSRPSIWR